MTTHENRPASETPDWVAIPGDRCGGCDASKNLCRVTRELNIEATCCNGCSHTGSRDIVYPVAYYGD